jgi:AraC-like DNA-binding protein
MVKPKIERVKIPAGCSVRVYDRRIPELPFEWHRHPEIELTLTLNSEGLRFVGDHIGTYGARDLVLVPPDMPHTWASRAAIDGAKPHRAVVIWFLEKWALQMAELCPEYGAIPGLLKRAKGALSFGAGEAGLVLERLPELLAESSATRLGAVLAVLNGLAEAAATPLATAMKTGQVDQNSRTQLNRVLDVLHSRYGEAIQIGELCEAGNLSSRTLHRLFLKQVGENVSDYLRKLRIGHACLLLVETDLPISVIAGRVGFLNLSNFNRAFFRTKSMTPRELRRFVQQHRRLPKLVAASGMAEAETSFILQQDRMRQARTA